MKHIYVGVILVSGACFVLGCVAIAIPHWGQFQNRVIQESGHFGPWTVCKYIDYRRKLCGKSGIMFKPFFTVYFAGISAAVGTSVMGLYGILHIVLTTMSCSPLSPLNLYKIYIIIANLVLSFTSGLLTWVAIGLFVTQTSDVGNGYTVGFGTCFYIELVVGFFAIMLLLLTVREYVIERNQKSRRGGDGGDDDDKEEAGWDNNGKYEESGRGRNGNMTPYYPEYRGIGKPGSPRRVPGRFDIFGPIGDGRKGGRGAHSSTVGGNQGGGRGGANKGSSSPYRNRRTSASGLRGSFGSSYFFPPGSGSMGPRRNSSRNSLSGSRERLAFLRPGGIGGIGERRHSKSSLSGSRERLSLLPPGFSWSTSSLHRTGSCGSHDKLCHNLKLGVAYTELCLTPQSQRKQRYHDYMNPLP